MTINSLVAKYSQLLLHVTIAEEKSLTETDLAVVKHRAKGKAIEDYTSAKFELESSEGVALFEKLAKHEPSVKVVPYGGTEILLIGEGKMSVDGMLRKLAKVLETATMNDLERD